MSCCLSTAPTAMDTHGAHMQPHSSHTHAHTSKYSLHIHTYLHMYVQTHTHTRMDIHVRAHSDICMLICTHGKPKAIDLTGESDKNVVNATPPELSCLPENDFMIKSPFGVHPQVRLPACEFRLCSCFQLPGNSQPGRRQMRAPKVVLCHPACGFLVLGFRLAQPVQVELTESSLFVSLLISLCHCGTNRYSFLIKGKEDPAL